MSFPPFPSNGETNWGNKMQAWSDAVEDQKAQGPGMTFYRDNTVGERFFVDFPGATYMLYGDTGWRNLSSLLSNGYSGTLMARRVGNVAWWYGALNFPTESSAIVFLDSIPEGLARAVGSNPVMIARNSNSGEVGAITVAGNLAWAGSISTGPLRFQASYHTVNSWPTTLFGSN